LAPARVHAGIFRMIGTLSGLCLSLRAASLPPFIALQNEMSTQFSYCAMILLSGNRSFVRRWSDKLTG
jgi:hypothetical protein